MKIQWGKDPEYTIHLLTDLSYWALPICIYWYGPHGCNIGIAFSVSLKILCFGVELEIWKWAEASDRIRYKNKCHSCYHEWCSETAEEICPECKEEDNIGTDANIIGDNNLETTDD